MKKKGLVFAGLTVAAAAFAAYIYQQNNMLGVTRVAYQNNKIPPAYYGYKILHLSDLHCKVFGDNNEPLLALIQKEAPDLIVMTGDAVDRIHGRPASVLDFFVRALRIAPVYYVPGNHEARVRDYSRFRAAITADGVRVLENETEPLYRDGAVMELIGIADPAFSTYARKTAIDSAVTRQNLSGLLRPDAQNLQILLSHRPELIDLYAGMGADLVFTGHAHGGQWRLPGTDGLFAPHQGLLPQLTSGVIRRDGTTMIVSRGLGNSGFPVRINNRPELISVTLVAAAD